MAGRPRRDCVAKNYRTLAGLDSVKNMEHNKDWCHDKEEDDQDQVCEVR